MRRLPQIPLLVSVAAAFFARAVVAYIALVGQGPSVFLVSDSRGYLGLAANLVRGVGFIDWLGNVDVFRTPGYPAVLTLGVLTGQPILAALLLNMLFAAAIAVLTFRVARRLFDDERVAGLCALIVAIEPTMLAWSLKVMPETLLTLCILLFTDFALRALETRELRWWIAAAIALSIAAYVKPIAYPLVAIAFLASLFVRAWRESLVFLAVSVALLAPWHLRNARYGYNGFSTLVDRALYLSAGGSILAKREHRPYDDVHRELLAQGHIREPLDDPDRYARIRREGAALVASDPLGYAVTHVKGTLRTLFDPGAAEVLRFLGLYSSGGRAAAQSGGVLATARAFPLAFWSSIALGIALLPLVVLPLFALRHANRAFLVLAVVAAYLVVAGGGVPGYARFRVPAVPLLVLMSGFVLAPRRMA